MKHLNEHLRRANQKLAIAKGQLEKGMVVEMMYKPEKGNLKLYVLTVLNANYQGKLHAISMENISHNAYTDFVDGVGIRYIPRYQKYRGVNVSKVIMDISSRRFYVGKLRDNLKDCYRTFNVKKINSIRLIDYAFDKKLIEKYLAL